MKATAPRILVVEDDPDLRELLRWHLVREGFLVSLAEDGFGAVQSFVRDQPSAVLLDVMLPGADGWKVCQQIRALDSRARRTPLIFVTARTTEADLLHGLELGADDFVRKPFRPKEVVARLRAVLRRRPEDDGDSREELSVGPLTVRHDSREVTVDGRPIVLTATEYGILHAFMSAPGRILSREQLIARERPHNEPRAGRAIDVHIRSLRVKLGTRASMIETVRGVGYRMVAPIRDASEAAPFGGQRNA
ncbi:response regulator transcription factor [Opitutales bacterium ASA1]|uniref:response regulator transcription factor n=1 Tax=Congregicoccus parvus TaxID=3081749 RepID=UPI002B2F6827|nr:response regulator transcription factor [Opitutales bacterium ASA1]